MLSQTRRGLEDFDNQHDFERLAADVLNALGYSGVEPMAPGGGPDGGRDIQFKEGDTRGVALVTLNKKIRDKFKSDLLKQPANDGVMALFCNVDITPSMKAEFAKDAIAKGYRLEVFDLERLRSLLDACLTQLRKRYLGLDDEAAARLRSEVKRLIRFPGATGDNTKPPTMLEGMLVNKLPWRLFELLMGYDERDVREVPAIGHLLHGHLTDYYEFRQSIMALESRLTLRIGTMVSVRFTDAWRMYLKYAILRFASHTKETIIGWGNFLNYGITWDDTEEIFQQLGQDSPLHSEIDALFQTHERLCENTASFAPQQVAKGRE